jgi:hypothetical protein
MVQGLDPSLAIGYGNGPRHPGIQVDEYQPRSVNHKPRLVLSPDAISIIQDSLMELMGGEIDFIECQYKDGPETMACIPDAVRWVILGQPRMCCWSKREKEHLFLEKGMKLGQGRVTATRLFLCAVIGDRLIMAEDGAPAIFSLRLTSTKTDLVSGGNGRGSVIESSVASLNEALCRHYSVRRGSLTHLVSVKLAAKVHQLANSQGESSLAIMFHFDGKAKPLPMTLQQQMTALASSDEVRALLTDPFGINRESSASESIGEPVDEITYEDIQPTYA